MTAKRRYAAMLARQGQSVPTIAGRIGVHRSTIYRWRHCQRYRPARGNATYRGRTWLTTDQIRAIRHTIWTRTPRNARYSGQRPESMQRRWGWTVDSIRHMLQDRYPHTVEAHLRDRGLRRWLRSIGVRPERKTAENSPPLPVAKVPTPENARINVSCGQLELTASRIGSNECDSAGISCGTWAVKGRGHTSPDPTWHEHPG